MVAQQELTEEQIEEKIQQELIRAAQRQWDEEGTPKNAIAKLLETGQKIENGNDSVTRDDFEKLVDSLLATPAGDFLTANNRCVGATNLGVIRAIIGPKVGGQKLKPVEFARGVNDRSGKRSY